MFSRVTCIVITIATRLHCLLLLLFSWVLVTRVWQYKDVVTSLVLLLVRNNGQEAAAQPPVSSPQHIVHCPCCGSLIACCPAQSSHSPEYGRMSAFYQTKQSRSLAWPGWAGWATLPLLNPTKPTYPASHCARPWFLWKIWNNSNKRVVHVSSVEKGEDKVPWLHNTCVQSIQIELSKNNFISTVWWFSRTEQQLLLKIILW